VYRNQGEKRKMPILDFDTPPSAALNRRMGLG